MRKLAADAGWAAIGLIALALRFSFRFVGREASR
jgi:hypothetical protein